MKKINFFLLSVFFAALFVFNGGCSNENKTKESTKSEKLVEKVVEVNKAQVLVDYLEANGNFINSKNVPSMIKAEEVYENLDNPKYLIVDIRKSADFNKGHIKNAVHVKAADMITYFENDIVPADYEKIAIVCYSGQSASFATSVMRLLGYNNVYTMKWGMSSWAMPYGNIWLKHVGNNFADRLESASNAKDAEGQLPKLKIALTDAKEILKARAKELLAMPFRQFTVKAEGVFAHADNYYINNYWPEAKYEEGHIPGAVQYQPKKSLDTQVDLLTLPTNKKIVTYCYTGQHSAFVTAYLRILGYDAYSLLFGANSFMNGLMQERGEGWHAFTKEIVHDFEVVKEGVEESVDENTQKGECGS